MLGCKRYTQQSYVTSFYSRLMWLLNVNAAAFSCSGHLGSTTSLRQYSRVVSRFMHHKSLLPETKAMCCTPALADRQSLRLPLPSCSRLHDLVNENLTMYIVSNTSRVRQSASTLVSRSIMWQRIATSTQRPTFCIFTVYQCFLNSMQAIMFYFFLPLQIPPP